MKITFCISVAALVLGFGTAQAATINLVTNGSFEQGLLGIGSFQGWQTTLGDDDTFVDSDGQTGPVYGEAYVGLWSAFFGTTAADGGSSISQVLSTTPKQAYLLTFDLANDNAGQPPSNSFVASVGGSPVLTFTNLPNQNYVAEQYVFVASGTSTALSFSGYNDQSYLELDNVAVAPIPEPAAFGLVLVGLLGAGGMRRLLGQ